jgi:hypothetical protein
MINAEDEVTIDLRRSCTREEAAIKILGWMRGPIQKVASETDDPLNSLLNNGKFNSPLTDLLQKEREAARQDMLDAVDAGVDTTVFINKEYSVKRLDELIYRVTDYLDDIDDELAKTDQSALRIDQITTEKTATEHISLRSLDAWARSKYGISIRGEWEPTQPQESFASQPNNQPQPDGTISENDLETREKNLFVTLALLAKVLADAVPGGTLRSGGDFNSSAIAKRVFSEASKTGDRFTGQSEEAVRKRLDKAKKILR